MLSPLSTRVPRQEAVAIVGEGSCCRRGCSHIWRGGEPLVAREEVQRAAVLRSARAEVVVLLCVVDPENAAGTEEFCRVLDDVMVKSLDTLKAVPVAPAVLASTGLAEAVAALREHESARIRGLAHQVFRGWRASVESELARATASIEELDKISGDEQQLQKTPSS